MVDSSRVPGRSDRAAITISPGKDRKRWPDPVCRTRRYQTQDGNAELELGRRIVFGDASPSTATSEAGCLHPLQLLRRRPLPPSPSTGCSSLGNPGTFAVGRAGAVARRRLSIPAAWTSAARTKGWTCRPPNARGSAPDASQVSAHVQREDPYRRIWPPPANNPIRADPGTASAGFSGCPGTVRVGRGALRTAGHLTPPPRARSLRPMRTHSYK